MDNCPKCKKNDDVEVNVIGVSCLCDRDFCVGQRCGANDMVKSYKCKSCDEVFNSAVYLNYREYHCRG